MGKRNSKKPKYITLLLVSNLVNNFGFALFAPLYGVYILQLGAQPATGSYIWAAYTLLTATLLLFFGRIENRNRNKLGMICAGNVLQLTGSAIILGITSIEGVLIGLLIYGSGTAMLAPSWYFIYSNHLNKGRGTEEWSWSTGGASFAVALGAALGGFLVANYSFKGVFVFMVISCFIGLFSVFKLYRSGYIR